METNGMGGGMLGGIASGLLGLEMPLHQQHQQQQHQLVSFSATDHHQSQPHQTQHKHHPFGYNPSKGKQQQQQQITALSDEEEQDGDSQSGVAGKRTSASPWQRMKWTDGMVRLLIMMVYYVGDDGGGSAADADSSSGKKKATGGGGGLLQKKGKWKSVSRAMMEKGFYVSPQQCEDKFNDLNKRYKRVNDILGKGTACRVVENQSLLDTMDHISPKTKEEVRKLLNSKHLFFREMCAYHSSCGTNAAGGVAAPAIGQDSSSQQQQQQLPQHLQQRCFHTDSVAASAMRRERGGREEDEDDRGDGEEEDEEEDSDDDEDEDDEEIEDGGEHRGSHGQEDDKGQLSMPPQPSSKRQRPWSFTLSSPAMQQLSCELMGVMQDGTKSLWEQRQWLRNRLTQLEEQQVGYQCQAFELEKQRFKWLKFSGKKERELERLKLDNERTRLENERMVLMLRHKELELDLHSKRPDHPSSITTG